MRLINKFKTNRIIKRDGFGPFKGEGLLSFLNQSCTVCKSKINTLALGNALEIVKQEVIFLCMKCRNVNHNLMQQQIEEYRQNGLGYFNLDTDSFKGMGTDQYALINYLDSNYHADINVNSIDIVMYLRGGVYGSPQLGNYSSRRWVTKTEYSSFYNNWEKLTNCPECGGFLRNNFHSPYKSEIENSHECPHCAISIDAFWNYRNTLESDLENLGLHV